MEDAKISNVELVCDRRVRQIFSDEFLYDNDSKRVPEKVFQHEPEASVEKPFLLRMCNL